jgi:ryanodine receptor 2
MIGPVALMEAGHQHCSQGIHRKQRLFNLVEPFLCRLNIHVRDKCGDAERSKRQSKAHDLVLERSQMAEEQPEMPRQPKLAVGNVLVLGAVIRVIDLEIFGDGQDSSALRERVAWRTAWRETSIAETHDTRKFRGTRGAKREASDGCFTFLVRASKVQAGMTRQQSEEVDVSYEPDPIYTSKSVVTPDIVELTELLAKNSHDVWAQQRIKDGWKFGAKRDDAKKEHPCLVPYEDLPESEKQYDRNAAMETLKAIIALGYRVERADGRS